MGHRRGGYKLWRLAKEKVKKKAIRPRFPKATEFMFRGAFSYDRKAPCHIWRPKTTLEKKASKVELQKINEAIESELRVAWQLTTGMRRLGLRNKPDKKPQFRMTKENGAFQRNGKNGGIDWYRYLTTILLHILIPFGVECQIDRPDTIIQEDKAPSHKSHHQQIYCKLCSVWEFTEQLDSKSMEIKGYKYMIVDQCVRQASRSTSAPAID